MSDDQWANACGWLQAALDKGGNTHSLEDVFAGWRSGEYQIWTNEASVVVTHVIRYPRKTVLNHWLAGGDMEAIKRLQPMIAAFAKASGCSRELALGVRCGGSKVMRAEGFTHLYDVMAREL